MFLLLVCSFGVFFLHVKSMDQFTFLQNFKTQNEELSDA